MLVCDSGKPAAWRVACGGHERPLWCRCPRAAQDRRLSTPNACGSYKWLPAPPVVPQVMSSRGLLSSAVYACVLRAHAGHAGALQHAQASLAVLPASLWAFAVTRQPLFCQGVGQHPAAPRPADRPATAARQPRRRRPTRAARPHRHSPRSFRSQLPRARSRDTRRVRPARCAAAQSGAARRPAARARRCFARLQPAPAGVGRTARRRTAGAGAAGGRDPPRSRGSRLHRERARWEYMQRPRLQVGVQLGCSAADAVAARLQRAGSWAVRHAAPAASAAQLMSHSSHGNARHPAPTLSALEETQGRSTWQGRDVVRSIGSLDLARSLCTQTKPKGSRGA
jgi:hypothetical protein